MAAVVLYKFFWCSCMHERLWPVWCKHIWYTCDRASYMKMTRGTNLMQQLWFIIINISTCPKHVEIFMIYYHNCCIKLVPLIIFIYDARSHIHQTIKSLRSQNGPIIYSLLSHTLKIDPMIWKTALSVETLSWQPHCSLARMLLLTKWYFNIWKLSNSNILKETVSKYNLISVIYHLS